MEATAPLPFREAINKFVGNLSVTSNHPLTRNGVIALISIDWYEFFDAGGTVEVVGVKRLFALWVGQLFTDRRNEDGNMLFV